MTDVDRSGTRGSGGDRRGPGAAVDETALTDPLLDPAVYAGDPFPLYARLRAEAPVARNDTLGLWMVSRHADVVAVSRDPGRSARRRGS